MSFAKMDLSEVFTQVYAQCTLIIYKSHGGTVQFLDKLLNSRMKAHLCVSILAVVLQFLNGIQLIKSLQ